MTPDNIGLVARPQDPLDDVQTGQPLWYWALPRESKERILAERARKADCTYVQDLSRTGMLPDGSPPPKAKRKYDGPGLKITAARRAAIEARTQELLNRRKTSGAGHLEEPGPAGAGPGT